MLQRLLRFARLALLALLVHRPTAASAAPITIDFETLSDLDSVAGSFAPDVTFTDATVLAAGASLNELEFPPRSGANVAVNNGGPIRLDFASPLASFAAYFTYNTALTIDFFDASGLLGTVLSVSDNNLAMAGVTPPNELLSALFPATYLTIQGDLGGSFTLDDVTYEFADSTSTPVPEPGTLVLIGSGAAVWARRQWKSARPPASQSTTHS